MAAKGETEQLAAYLEEHPGVLSDPRHGALIDRSARTDAILRGVGPLHYAARAGFLGVMEVLLKNGVSVDGRSDGGETPLFYALKAGPRVDVIDTIKVLLDHDASVHMADETGKAPLQIARRMKKPNAKEILRLLEESDG